MISPWVGTIGVQHTRGPFMSTTIDAAESVVRDLQGKHAAAIARQAELAAERQAIAFAAHTGDANARATLTELNAEDAVLTGEVASLLAAIDEAKARAAAAHRQAETAARHAAPARPRSERRRSAGMAQHSTRRLMPSSTSSTTCATRHERCAGSASIASMRRCSMPTAAARCTRSCCIPGCRRHFSRPVSASSSPPWWPVGAT
jgi:hypothetical protein